MTVPPLKNYKTKHFTHVSCILLCTEIKTNILNDKNSNIQQKKTYSKNQGFTQEHTKGKATSYH